MQHAGEQVHKERATTNKENNKMQEDCSIL